MPEITGASGPRSGNRSPMDFASSSVMSCLVLLEITYDYRSL
jgi:hypothetical protein